MTQLRVEIDCEPCTDVTLTCFLCWKAECTHQAHFRIDGRHSVFGVHESCAEGQRAGNQAKSAPQLQPHRADVCHDTKIGLPDRRRVEFSFFRVKKRSTDYDLAEDQIRREEHAKQLLEKLERETVALLTDLGFVVGISVEPSQHIANGCCPCCGANLRIEHGDDPGEARTTEPSLSGFLEKQK